MGAMLDKIQAVIFDLDGVIVSTDDCHFEGWKQMADQEGIPFTRQDNERLRGVSRMESLEIILEKSTRSYTPEEKEDLATMKNEYYKQLVDRLSPENLLPGAMDTLTRLKAKGIKVAIGSSSKNTPLILARIGLADFFDAIADGNQIKNSKPDPEVFLLAAKKLSIPPVNCLVVEDADAGVEAALAGGMRVLGVGAAAANNQATLTASNLKEANLPAVL